MVKMYKQVLLLSVFGCFNACAMDEPLAKEEDKKQVEALTTFEEFSYNQMRDLKKPILKADFQGAPIEDACERVGELRLVSKEFNEWFHDKIFLAEVFRGCAFPKEYSSLQVYCVSAYLGYLVSQKAVSDEDIRIIKSVGDKKEFFKIHLARLQKLVGPSGERMPLEEGVLERALAEALMLLSFGADHCKIPIGACSECETSRCELAFSFDNRMPELTRIVGLKNLHFDLLSIVPTIQKIFTEETATDDERRWFHHFFEGYCFAAFGQVPRSQVAGRMYEPFLKIFQAQLREVGEQSLRITDLLPKLIRAYQFDAETQSLFKAVQEGDIDSAKKSLSEIKPLDVVTLDIALFLAIEAGNEEIALYILNAIEFVAADIFIIGRIQIYIWVLKIAIEKNLENFVGTFLQKVEAMKEAHELSPDGTEFYYMLRDKIRGFVISYSPSRAMFVKAISHHPENVQSLMMSYFQYESSIFFADDILSHDMCKIGRNAILL